jgi:hypothetical protein
MKNQQRSSNHRVWRRWAVNLLAVTLLGSMASSTAFAGLTITPTFDSSITSDINAVAIENVINNAIAVYQSTFSDPINVTIKFQEMTSGLGHSNWWYYNISYQSYIDHLLSDQTTADDVTALANLPHGSNNPVNSSTRINVKTANLRAIGITGLNSGLAGGVDGIVGLNTHITDVGSPGTSGVYSLSATAKHEIDEILGLASAVNSGLLNNDPLPEDLFRYDSLGNRSYTNNSGARAFFSIDGTSDLAEFDNQADGGDWGDWRSGPLPSGAQPKVQDAFITPHANPALSVELRAMDVIGYDFAAVPEPNSVSLMMISIVASAIYRRRRRAVVGSYI